MPPAITHAPSSRAILSEREPAGGGLERIRLLVGDDLSSTHTRHGQYVEIVDGDERGYFAIASSPGERTWDLLVRDGGSMGSHLRALPLRSELTVSGAIGPGFPLEELRGRPLIVAVTGSAIGAVLSALGARIAEGDAPHTFLFYGVRDRADIALTAELDALRAAGVDVAVCLSRDHVDEPGFYKGYVQDVALAREWGLEHAGVFAAGNDAMIEGMRNAAPSLGLSSDDVRLNA